MIQSQADETYTEQLRGDARPTQRARATRGHVHTEPPGPPRPRRPRPPRGSPGSSAATAPPAELHGEGRTDAACIRSGPRGPRPPSGSAPGPDPLDSPRDPASRAPSRAAAPIRVSRVPGGLPAPPRAETAGPGEGRPRPAGPRGGCTPPPGPAAFPPSLFEQLPPALLLRPAPAPSRGRTAAATPVPGSAPGLGRGGSGAPPERCRGPRAAGGGRAGPLPPRGGGSARPRGGSARRYLHLARLDPASAPPPAAILEPERKARAAREAQSSPERRLGPEGESRGCGSAERIERIERTAQLAEPGRWFYT